MLPYAILTLLRDGADHGYRLKQRLDVLLAPMWQVNIGQVYQVLDRLRRKGWVEELPPEAVSERGRERWPVAITAQGLEELERWTASPIRPTRPPGPARNDVVSRLAFGGERCIDRLLRDLVEERAVYAAEHERVTARCDELGLARSALDSAKRLALESARLEIRAHLEWVDLCLDHLRAEPLGRRGRDGRPRPTALLELRAGPAG